VAVDGDVNGDGDVLGKQLAAQPADSSVIMLSFQKLDVYRCAVELDRRHVDPAVPLRAEHVAVAVHVDVCANVL